MSTDHLTQLQARLMRLAQQPTQCYNCSPDDAADAVQETLIAFWARGKYWHEGRIVMELKNQIRRIRRKEKTRAHLNVPLEDIGNAV